jgi:hypothetical protein
VARIIPWPYMPCMGKKLLRWRITRIAGSRAAKLGVLEAPSAEAAIERAYEKFNIADLHE